ncbi:MAG: hypothetical protein IID59_03020, partial [Proteobacteria bacterium]|nr:hypothetical protein [Pseudomonadota bacterium]
MSRAQTYDFLIAQSSADPVEAPNPPKRGVPAGGVKLQAFDDPLPPFKPKKPRTAAEEARLDALALYLTGRIKRTRNDF